MEPRNSAIHSTLRKHSRSKSSSGNSQANASSRPAISITSHGVEQTRSDELGVASQHVDTEPIADQVGDPRGGVGIRVTHVVAMLPAATTCPHDPGLWWQHASRQVNGAAQRTLFTPRYQSPRRIQAFRSPLYAIDCLSGLHCYISLL